MTFNGMQQMVVLGSRLKGLVGLGWGAMLVGMSACAGPGVAPGGEVGSPAPEPGSTASVPRIVASGGVVCDLARQIAQADEAVTCLIPPGQDPHSYQPKPSDRRVLEQASLVLYGGYGFESGLLALIQTVPGERKRAIYEAAVPQPLMAEAHEHGSGHGDAHGDKHDGHGHGDKHDGDEHGDEHGHGHAPGEAQRAPASEHASPTAESPSSSEALQPDPHVWHNPQHGIAIARQIGEALAQAQVDAAQASQYRQRAEAIAAELSQIDAWIKTQVATIPVANRKLVTTHNAFGYYAAAYGLEAVGALEGLSTEEQPSPEAIAGLVEQVKAAKLPALFPEAAGDQRLIQVVAQEAGVNVAKKPLFVDGPGALESEAPTYQTMLRVNTCTVVEALGGICRGL